MDWRRIAPVLILLSMGCSGSSTPFPVTPIVTRDPLATASTATAVPQGTRPPLRYGVHPNAVDTFPTEQLSSSFVAITPLTEPINADTYDALIGYGLQTGWEPIPIDLSPVSVVMSTHLPPLNNPQINTVVQQALNPNAMLTQLAIPGTQSLIPSTNNPRIIKTELANLGYPDGIILYATSDPLPGVRELIAQMQTANIQIELVNVPPFSTAAHLTFARIDHATRTHLSPEQQITDLYTLPMSYRVRDGLQTTFTAEGWLIVTR